MENDISIAYRTTNREATMVRARVVEAESSQLWAERVVLTDSHRKMLAT